MHGQPNGALRVRALTKENFDALSAEFGRKVADAVDIATNGGGAEAGTSDLEFAADQIVSLITAKGSPLVQATLSLGLGIDRDAVARLGVFQKVSATFQISAATFPDLGPMEALQALIGKLIESGVPTSAMATGNVQRH